MTDATQPTGALPPEPPPPPTFWQRFGRWAGIAAGIVIAVVGIIRLVIPYTVLPGCESSRMTDTLRSIFRNQKVEAKAITDIKTVSSSSSEVSCTATVDIGGEPEAIGFRSYWDGWTAQVAVQSSLPACESKRASDTLHNIFKQRKIAIDRVSNQKTVTSSDSERTCTAQVEAPGELANISYRIFRKEGQTQVLITEVKSQPK
jgi:hypothetical protein